MLPKLIIHGPGVHVNRFLGNVPGKPSRGMERRDQCAASAESHERALTPSGGVSGGSRVARIMGVEAERARQESWSV